MTQQYIAQITAVSIRQEGEPIFDETAITVRIEDEGGGQFIVVEQDCKQIRFDADEWPLIRDEIEAAVGRCEP